MSGMPPMGGGFPPPSASGHGETPGMTGSMPGMGPGMGAGMQPPMSMGMGGMGGGAAAAPPSVASPTFSQFSASPTFNQFSAFGGPQQNQPPAAPAMVAMPNVSMWKPPPSAAPASNLSAFMGADLSAFQQPQQPLPPFSPANQQQQDASTGQIAVDGAVVSHQADGGAGFPGAGDMNQQQQQQAAQQLQQQQYQQQQYQSQFYSASHSSGGSGDEFQDVGL
jgi:hypothetical protein